MQRNNLSEENLLASRDGARSILADIFPKRRSRFAIFASFATVSLLGFLFFTFWTEQPRSQAIIGEDISQPGNTTHSTLSGILDPFGPEANLIGAPTPQFRGIPQSPRRTRLHIHALSRQSTTGPQVSYELDFGGMEYVSY